MTDNLLTLKAATIERCVKRAREEYLRESATFDSALPRQDTAILYMLRACEAVLHIGQHLVQANASASRKAPDN